MIRCLICFLVFITTVATAQLNRAEKIYEKVNDAVVRIYASNANNRMEGQGSGVILKSKRWIITNAHVAGNSKVLYAEHNGVFFELDSFIVKDDEADIMVIRIKKSSGTDE